MGHRPSRLSIYWRIVIRPAWRWAVLTPFAALGAFQVIREELPPEWQAKLQLPSPLDWPWTSFVIVGLVVALFFVMESAYRVIAGQASPGGQPVSISPSTQERWASEDVESAVTYLTQETVQPISKTTLSSRKQKPTSYSLAQLLLGTADVLAVGSLDEAGFRRAMAEWIDSESEDGYAYWDVESSVVTHILGKLIRSGAVERRREEYEARVTEGGFQTDPILGHTGQLTYEFPHKHTAKGVQVRYYLTALGIEVVKQLHQQQGARMEGSQS